MPMVPFFAQHALKLSCSLALVYLFYQLVLRRLTFYNWNRWYLLLYTALSFAIPFINIAPFLEHHRLSSTNLVQLVPALRNYASDASIQAAAPSTPLFSAWVVAFYVFVCGCAVLLLRLLFQWLSYRRIRKGAQLLAHNGMRVYQSSKATAPFSFGNAIFINQRLHSEAELQEIIRHEFVHVRQRHTFDIVWMELVCILNWYNPAAWLLRHAVRQNLEFIADAHVLESGVDRKAYQYLLLKVMGQPQFCMAAPFNFSSLKKRIVMMNRLKTAKAHLLKFLFALPLLAVLLLAFRTGTQETPPAGDQPMVTVSGIVADASTEEPLAGVLLREALSGRTATTDARGYFSISVAVKYAPERTEIEWSKPGFETMHSNFSFDKNRGAPDGGFIQLIDMARPGQPNASVHSVAKYDDAASKKVPIGYHAVLKKFEEKKRAVQTERKLKALTENSEKPYWVVDGKSFIVSNGGSWAGTDAVTDIVFVDGKRMTGAEVNRTIKRSSFNSAGAMEGESAKLKYGIAQPVLEIYLNTKPGWDPAPPPVDTPIVPEDLKTFLKRNPGVKGIGWREDEVIIELKSGKKEVYRRNDPKSMDAAWKKWGALPVAPPPPPPIPSNEAPMPPPAVDPSEEQFPIPNDSLYAAANAQLAQASKQYELELKQYRLELEQYKQELKQYKQDLKLYEQERQVAMQGHARRQQMINKQKTLLQYKKAQQHLRLQQQKAQHVQKAKQTATNKKPLQRKPSD